VTPAEIWVGFQHQGDHAADHRRCGRGAVERSVVDLAERSRVLWIVAKLAYPVGRDVLIETGDRTRTWSRRRADQQVGAGVGIVRHEASMEDGADDDRMAADVGRLAVGVARAIADSSLIAGGLEDDRAKASSPGGGRCKQAGDGVSIEGVSEVPASPTVVGDVEIAQ